MYIEIKKDYRVAIYIVRLISYSGKNSPYFRVC